MKFYFLNALLFIISITLGWYVNPLFILFCFCPVFNIYQNHKVRYKFICIYSLFLCYNFIATFWLLKTDYTKGIVTILLNAVLMTVAASGFQLFQYKNKFLKVTICISIWILFEYIHNIWDISWPWLTLGNAFGSRPEYVIWYSITGVCGGSIWVITSSYLLHVLIYLKKNTKLIFFALSLIVLLPLILSLNYSKSISYSKKQDITLIHTNIKNTDTISDNEKIKISVGSLERMRHSSIIVFPELFISSGVVYGEFQNTTNYFELKRLINKSHTLNLVLGITLIKEKPEKITTVSFTGQSENANNYNGAILINSDSNIYFKGKKIFIPLSEKVPWFLKFKLWNSAYFSTLDENNDFFKIQKSKVFVTICYEAVNSVFFANNFRNENFIIMLASEAFFKGSEIGKEQYLNICRLKPENIFLNLQIAEHLQLLTILEIYNLDIPLKTKFQY